MSSEGSGSGSSSNANRSTEGNRTPNANPGQPTPSTDHASTTNPGPSIRGDELPLHHVFGQNSSDGPPEEHVAFQMYNHGRGPSRGGPSLGPPRPPKEYRGPAIMYASNSSRRPKRKRSPDRLQAMDGEVSDVASAVQERPNPLRALVDSAVAEVDQRVAELGTRAPKQEANQVGEGSNEPINNQANQGAELASPPGNNRVPDLDEMPPPEDDKC